MLKVVHMPPSFLKFYCYLSKCRYAVIHISVYYNSISAHLLQYKFQMLWIAFQNLQALASIYSCPASLMLIPTEPCKCKRTHYLTVPECIIFSDCCTTWSSPFISLSHYHHHHHNPTTHTHTHTPYSSTQPSSTCLTPPHWSRLNSVNYLTLKPFQFLPYRGMDIPL